MPQAFVEIEELDAPVFVVGIGCLDTGIILVEHRASQAARSEDGVFAVTEFSELQRLPLRGECIQIR